MHVVWVSRDVFTRFAVTSIYEETEMSYPSGRMASSHRPHPKAVHEGTGPGPNRVSLHLTAPGYVASVKEK